MRLIGRRPFLAAAVVAGLITTIDLATPPDQPSDVRRVIAPTVPTFSVRWRNDALVLSGDTFSAGHEDDLQRQAKRWFSDATLLTNFEPLGMVPDYWPAVTTALPGVLRNAQSGDAVLTASVLKFNVVADDQSPVAGRIAELVETLPQELSVHSDIVSIDRSFSVREACQKATEAFSTGPIGFEENSPVLLTSSWPRLDRIAALANGCTHLLLAITGHTDSSGNEEWNQTLSTQRANAVSTYLQNRGVSKQHLRVEGAGSSRPIASNTTRYGRSINRRIEVEFVED